tara:strand:+ start:193 stop:384 length:192 start_codon:yes stop_codon:yes gene_type:complete
VEKSEKKEPTIPKGLELSIKNVIVTWNNLSIVKKIGGMVLLIVGWLIIIDDWLGLDDIIDVLG